LYGKSTADDLKFNFPPWQNVFCLGIHSKPPNIKKSKSPNILTEITLKKIVRPFSFFRVICGVGRGVTNNIENVE
jgi:hypothetical protein